LPHVYVCLYVKYPLHCLNAAKHEVSLHFSKVLKYHFLKSVQWKPSCSMWTVGRTDSHHEPNTRFSEMCEVLDIIHFVIYVKRSQGTDLRSLESKGQCLRMK